MERRKEKEEREEGNGRDKEGGLSKYYAVAVRKSEVGGRRGGTRIKEKRKNERGKGEKKAKDLTGKRKGRKEGGREKEREKDESETIEGRDGPWNGAGNGFILGDSGGLRFFYRGYLSCIC